MPLYLKDKLVSGTGAPGKSAYEAAKQGGFTGTEAEFNQALNNVPGHISNKDNPHDVTASQVGAYTKEQTNALLDNNDPRNWGLDLSKTISDANEATRNGFYTMAVGAANVPFDYGVLLVHNIGNPNYLHQELTEFLGGIKACRGGAWNDSTSSVKWEPWEWVNPPFNQDTVYRTTEKYLGNPVYKKIDSAGIIWWSTDQETWKAEAERVGAASKATEDKVMATSIQGSVSVSIQASELQSYINSLPKMLTNNYYITVSGTCSSAVEVSYFYGDGLIAIKSENIGDCVFSAPINVYYCKNKIVIEKIRFNLPANNNAAAIRSGHCNGVVINECEFIGSSKEKSSGVGTDGPTSINVNYCKFKNLYIPIHLFGGGIIYVNCNSADMSNNTYGVYSYYGGFVQLLGNTPNTVGGGSNYKNGGGAIINAAGQLI